MTILDRLFGRKKKGEKEKEKDKGKRGTNTPSSETPSSESITVTDDISPREDRSAVGDIHPPPSSPSISPQVSPRGSRLSATPAVVVEPLPAIVVCPPNHIDNNRLSPNNHNNRRNSDSNNNNNNNNHNNHNNHDNHDKTKQQPVQPHVDVTPSPSPPTPTVEPETHSTHPHHHSSGIEDVHDNNNIQNTNNRKTPPIQTFEPWPFEAPKVRPPEPGRNPKSVGPPEILPDEIVKSDFLGQGSFGSVYKGMCRGQAVAVKVPRKQNLSIPELTSFRHEVRMMSKIYHPNVVLFLGACVTMPNMQIVTELCVTDLEKLLAREKVTRRLSLYSRMLMARDAALGMAWLHGINKVVHNDLKSANLLIDQYGKVKVTDFGFSQIKENDGKFQDKNKKGTPLWMAPEVMMSQMYDEKADVYSFAIIMWEILTCDVPYAHHRDYDTFYKAVCVQGERPVLPLDTPPSLKYLITQCWNHEPSIRPSFDEIVFRLGEVLVDCAVDNFDARNFWKTHFLAPSQQLQEEVPWKVFESIVTQTLGASLPSPSLPECIADLKSLLLPPLSSSGSITSDNVTLERFDKVVKWFGTFWNASVLTEIHSMQNKMWFHGEITREEAVARLSKHEEANTYLIRLSNTDPKSTPFTLSMPGDLHRRIKVVFEDDERETGVRKGYKIHGKQTLYSTLTDLAEKCLDYNLRYPCPKISHVYNPYDPYSEVPSSG